MSHRRNNGFTLIELLVVIAIIAILAAILFPVFAQAREKARQITCVSNMKQLGLGILQYVQDFDETYSPGFTDWVGTATTWPVAVSPYVKTFKVYQCPDDSLAFANSGNTWEGTPISYVANGVSVWDGAISNFRFRGLFCPMQDTIGDWSNPTITGPETYAADMNIRTLAGVGRPADTIMLAEVHNQDGLLAGSPGGTFSAWQTNTLTNYFGGEAIPNGASTSAYPYGPNGDITPAHASKTLANFLFADGHVKSLRPAQTDPDEYNQPDKDMWDATRQ